MLSRSVCAISRRAVSRATAPRAMMATSAMTEVDKDAPAPTVFDKTIQLTFVDPSGARRKVPGYVGKCKQNMTENGKLS